ncbi:hypothetical protein CEUSTIGMA_g199.t1 [Chlamydomonas eustigma]|uniref:Uncharacterized protein n=1 Tax=Chlamydomonas eustigma TaxID=1157962 RepID=A0A250WPJ7_9CHLO|nr:hypothetical protein CEUSTIGMA_g199.t1 [Chlamydomonas eustigma]|eukprot:GAX72743.1 hypothetical protein CEUSTIGMA_g199.t1 [Chlamydomonas eustigma]
MYDTSRCLKRWVPSVSCKGGLQSGSLHDKASSKNMALMEEGREKEQELEEFSNVDTAAQDKGGGVRGGREARAACMSNDTKIILVSVGEDPEPAESGQVVDSYEVMPVATCRTPFEEGCLPQDSATHSRGVKNNTFLGHNLASFRDKTRLMMQQAKHVVGDTPEAASEAAGVSAVCMEGRIMGKDNYEHLPHEAAHHNDDHDIHGRLAEYLSPKDRNPQTSKSSDSSSRRTTFSKAGDTLKAYAHQARHAMKHPKEAVAETAGRIMGRDNYQHPYNNPKCHSSASSYDPTQKTSP